MRSNEESEILYTFNLPANSEREIVIKIYEPILFASDLVLPVEFENLPDGQSGVFNKRLDVEKLRALLALAENFQ